MEMKNENLKEMILKLTQKDIDFNSFSICYILIFVSKHVYLLF